VKTYRAQVLAEVPRGWTRDDLLASVVSEVSAVAEVERASVMSLVRNGVQKVAVVFKAETDTAAWATAGRMRGSLTADVLLDVLDGRKYRRIR